MCCRNGRRNHNGPLLFVAGKMAYNKYQQHKAAKALQEQPQGLQGPAQAPSAATLPEYEQPLALTDYKNEKTTPLNYGDEKTPFQPPPAYNDVIVHRAEVPTTPGFVDEKGQVIPTEQRGVADEVGVVGGTQYQTSPCAGVCGTSSRCGHCARGCGGHCSSAGNCGWGAQWTVGGGPCGSNGYCGQYCGGVCGGRRMGCCERKRQQKARGTGHCGAAFSGACGSDGYCGEYCGGMCGGRRMGCCERKRQRKAAMKMLEIG